MTKRYQDILIRDNALTERQPGPNRSRRKLTNFGGRPSCVDKLTDVCVATTVLDGVTNENERLQRVFIGPRSTTVVTGVQPSRRIFKNRPYPERHLEKALLGAMIDWIVELAKNAVRILVAIKHSPEATTRQEVCFTIDIDCLADQGFELNIRVD